MNISTEIFFIPYNRDKYMLYAPLKRIIILVNEKLKTKIEENKELDHSTYTDLKKYGIVDSKPDKLPPEPNTDIPMTSVPIFLTTDCNLRCIYCYANAGIKKFTMDKNDVANIVKYIVNNAKKMNRNQIHITFHGGGEPTYKWDLFTWSVEYAKNLAKENNLKLTTFISTNLFVSEKKVEWLAKNIDSIQISFDGPKDIQNYQRPAVGGKPTFDVVFRNIKLLDRMKKIYSIRSTITKYSVNRMEEILSFFTKNMKYLNSVHFEPMFSSGRGIGLEQPDLDIYVKNFKKSYDLAVKKHIRFFSSESDIIDIKSFHCGACGTNRVFLPNGYISTCFEVDYKDDPRSEIFFVGTFDKNGNIKINKEKIEYLKKRTVYNLEKCKNCFAKWHCAGGCLAKAKDIYAPPEYRCKVIRELTKYILSRIINGKKVLDIDYKTLPAVSNYIYKAVRFVYKRTHRLRIYF